MPIFEYQCCRCGIYFQTLILKREEEKNLICPKCESPKPKKLISKTAYHMSETDRMERFDPDAVQPDSFYKDSRNIGLHAKKRIQAMGVDPGSSFDEKVEKLRTDPGSVIKDSE